MTKEEPTVVNSAPSTEESFGLVDFFVPLLRAWKWLVALPLLAAGVAIGVTYVMDPIFTARTTLLPPQQQQSPAASALASLGALSALSGAAVRTPADQYLSLMQSNAVLDQIIKRFELQKVYGTDLLFDTRRALLIRLQLGVGKKDGIITVEVDDKSPQRAADIANALVAELQNLTALLALTEAQQRRVFFEGQLKQNRERLAAAQQALQASGYTAEALRAEPRAAAESYAKLKAEVTGAEVRLQSLRQSLTDTAPEVRAQQGTLSMLRSRLAAAESAGEPPQGPDYVTKYREYKYQETLFDIFARQYELARLDEAKEGATMQIIDRATPPERRSRPRRASTAIAAFLSTLAAVLLVVETRYFWTRLSNHPIHGRQASRLTDAWSGRKGI